MADTQVNHEVSDEVKQITALTTSWGMYSDKALPNLLGNKVRFGLRNKPGDVVVGWGQKKKHEKIKAYAKKHGLPYWQLEDGFLGYLSHPALDQRRLSIIVLIKPVSIMMRISQVI